MLGCSVEMDRWNANAQRASAHDRHEFFAITICFSLRKLTALGKPRQMKTLP
jgi:hypothetical protein